MGRPCSNHCASPLPVGRPAWQAPFQTTLSSGSGCQSHIRQPASVSNSQVPLSQGWVQLICIESGSPGGQSGLACLRATCCAKAGPPANTQNEGTITGEIAMDVPAA